MLGEHLDLIDKPELYEPPGVRSDRAGRYVVSVALYVPVGDPVAPVSAEDPEDLYLVTGHLVALGGSHQPAFLPFSVIPSRAAQFATDARVTGRPDRERTS